MWVQTVSSGLSVQYLEYIRHCTVYIYQILGDVLSGSTLLDQISVQYLGCIQYSTVSIYYKM